MSMKFLVAALLAVTLVSAQGKKGGGSKGGGGDMPMSMMSRPSKAEQLVDKLKLSNEQKQEVQNIVNAAFEQSLPLRQQIDQGRVNIAGALIGGKSGDEINKMMGDYTTLAAQMTEIEAKTFNKIYASLKPNQQAKAAQAFELLVAVLETPSAGGGRGGRGRGRQ